MKMRRGKFKVAASIIENDCHNAADIFRLLDFVPMRVEALPMEGIFEYWGLSPLFSEIRLGEKIPSYEIIISTNVDGDVVSLDAVKERPGPC